MNSTQFQWSTKVYENGKKYTEKVKKTVLHKRVLAKCAQLFLCCCSFFVKKTNRRNFERDFCIISIKRKMIVHRMLDNDSSHNDNQQHSQRTNKMANNKHNGHNQNYQLYCNRDRNKLHLLLLFITIFMCQCCAVSGDSTGKHTFWFRFFIKRFFLLYYKTEFYIRFSQFRMWWKRNETKVGQIYRDEHTWCWEGKIIFSD